MSQQQLNLLASRPMNMDASHDQIGVVAQQHMQRIPPDWVPADLERPLPTNFVDYTMYSKARATWQKKEEAIACTDCT
eukprot:5182493-Amphidinium_carterae.1